MPSLPSDLGPILAIASRSGRIESWHRGSLAVWHADELLFALGDVASPVFCRSAVKPLQALPFFDRGLDQKFALGPAEIALLCASHDGTNRHVEIVRGLLQRGGFGEDLLGCGPHAPLDPKARVQLIQLGKEPLRVHNNCSGKHAGFLHLAAACGDSLDEYLDPLCQSQREVNDAVALMAAVSAPVAVGVDGCGAPTFLLPLSALARSFAKLANPTGLSAVRAKACSSILDAAGREPVLLAGERRFCTALLRSLPGRMFAKNGAEGVYAVALAPDARRTLCPGGVGIAIKIDDGMERGYQPVIVDLLLRLGVFSAGLPAGLQSFHVQPVLNTRGVQLGDLRCAFDWNAVLGHA